MGGADGEASGEYEISRYDRITHSERADARRKTMGSAGRWTQAHIGLEIPSSRGRTATAQGPACRARAAGRIPSHRPIDAYFRRLSDRAGRPPNR
jgi:hypothetical protein